MLGANGFAFILWLTEVLRSRCCVIASRCARALRSLPQLLLKFQFTSFTFSLAYVQNSAEISNLDYTRRCYAKRVTSDRAHFRGIAAIGNKAPYKRRSGVEPLGTLCTIDRPGNRIPDQPHR